MTNTDAETKKPAEQVQTAPRPLTPAETQAVAGARGRSRWVI